MLRAMGNFIADTLGFELEFDLLGLFLFGLVVVAPVVSMISFARLARRHGRPLALVALVPVVWLLPAASFWARTAWQLKALPLLGIGAGCVLWFVLFLAVGGDQSSGRAPPPG